LEAEGNISNVKAQMTKSQWRDLWESEFFRDFKGKTNCERSGTRATDQKALSEGTIVFTNEKHIPMKDQLVAIIRGGKTRKLRCLVIWMGPHHRL
jgi:hypothetical protein